MPMKRWITSAWSSFGITGISSTMSATDIFFADERMRSPGCLSAAHNIKGSCAKEDLNLRASNPEQQIRRIQLFQCFLRCVISTSCAVARPGGELKTLVGGARTSESYLLVSRPSGREYDDSRWFGCVPRDQRGIGRKVNAPCAQKVLGDGHLSVRYEGSLRHESMQHGMSDSMIAAPGGSAVEPSNRSCRAATSILCRASCGSRLRTSTSPTSRSFNPRKGTRFSRKS